MTVDSKTFVILLAILQAMSAALFFSSKVRASFAVSALTTLVVVLGTVGSWIAINVGEIVFLAVALALLAAAIAGTSTKVPAALWWVVWVANLLALFFSIYATFFFHIF